MSRRGDAGMVTAELAAALPALVVLVAAALTAVSALGQRVRAQDAAREVARAVARGDPAAGDRLARQMAPGGVATVSRSGSGVVADVRMTIHPLGGWLPAVQLVERAVAAAEPGADTGVTNAGSP